MIKHQQTYRAGEYLTPVCDVLVAGMSSIVCASNYGEAGSAGNELNEGNINDYEDGLL